MNILDFIRHKIGVLFARYDQLVVVAVAMTIGVAAGFGNIIFRTLIHFFQKLSFGIESEIVLYGLQTTPIWKIILVPALGGLGVGLIKKYFSGVDGHGVGDVIKAITLRRALSPLTGILKTITSAITLGTGGSAGREGPIVLIGASIGSAIGQLFKFSSSRMSTATACGAAGGLAATFNAPMGGAMFAAEVLLGEFGLKTFSPVMISSVTAVVISRWYYGNEVTFQAPEYVLKSYMELPFYAILGILMAFVAVFFIRFYYLVTKGFDDMRVPIWLKPAIGGLMMGVIAVFCRNIMGVGYGTVMEILTGSITGYVLLIFVFLKIVATSLTLGSGGSGGQFVPSLFIGAAFGGFFGWVVQAMFPDIAAGSGTYALVGMSAMLGAVMRAPITAIFMIFEITQSYHIVVPAMLCCIVANIVANSMEKDSIFTWPLTKQGFKFGQGIEQSVLGSILVRDIMMKDIMYFHEDTPYEEIKVSIARKPHAYFPVINNEGYLTGMISVNDLKNLIFKDKKLTGLAAKDLGERKNIITVTADETLLQALQDFGIKEVGDLPVVKHMPEGMQLIGLLRRSDIIIAYNKRMVDFSPAAR